MFLFVKIVVVKEYIWINISIFWPVNFITGNENAYFQYKAIMKPRLIDIPLSGKRAIQVKKVDQFYLDAPFHFHELCELVWIEESFGKRIVGDNVNNFSAGDLVLMSPDLPHIWQNDSIFFLKKRQFRTKATVIYFPPDFLLNLSDESAVIQPTQELVKRAARGLKFFGTTQCKVAEILSGMSEKDGLKKILDFLSVLNILTNSIEYEYLASVSYKNLYDEKDTDRMVEVYRFLIQNFHRDITLEEVSQIAHMSPTGFCRFFKSRTQKSFVQFLNELKIGHACKLLGNNDYSIADVCYESGYNNLANFNKFFRKITGKTPTQFKKELC